MSSAAEYDFACRAMRLGSTPEERRRAIVEEYLRENPGAQATDLNVTVTDTVVSEIATVTTRPATSEEIAALEIAERAVKAEDAFSDRLVPRQPRETNDGRT